jgi:hypothetical protein
MYPTACASVVMLGALVTEKRVPSSSQSPVTRGTFAYAPAATESKGAWVRKTPSYSFPSSASISLDWRGETTHDTRSPGEVVRGLREDSWRLVHRRLERCTGYQLKFHSGSVRYSLW